MQQELQEGENDLDDENHIKRTKFASQQIRTGGDASAATGPPMQRPRDDYEFQRGSYAPQGVDPRSDFLDSRLVQEMSSLSLPFSLVKIRDDPKTEGAWYVFGTKLVLISEYDDDLLKIREYQSKSDEHFNDYMQTHIESQYKHIQQMLRTTKQHLLKKNDPIQALSEDFVKMYTEILENDPNV